jgi:hypothetical protein
MIIFSLFLALYLASPVDRNQNAAYLQEGELVQILLLMARTKNHLQL